MVCEAFGGGVFAYVSQLCNDMCEEFDVYFEWRPFPFVCSKVKRFDLRAEDSSDVSSNMLPFLNLRGLLRTA